MPPGSEGGTTHLWEESWDDDDTSEDFSKQLKQAPSHAVRATLKLTMSREELAKVKGQK